MNRRKLFSRFTSLKSANQLSKRPDYFTPEFEPLESRELLTAVTWTLDSTLSSITTVIPDQTVTYSGTPIPVGVRNQTGSTTVAWNAGNSAQTSGQLATDYVDNSYVNFLGGQSSLNAIANSPGYRPNPAVFNGTTFTDHSVAPADSGGMLLVDPAKNDLTFGDSAQPGAYFNLRNLGYDLNSLGQITESGGTFAANVRI